MKKKISFYIAIILSIILALVLLIVLIVWTKQIERNKDELKFIELLETKIEKEGLPTVLKKANIDVNNIYDTEKGLEIFINKDYDKIVSIDEEINKKIYNKAKDSVVYISSKNGNKFNQGSGVIINKDGYILTNKHVLLEDTKPYIYLHNGETKIATIIGSDNDTDIALLKIEGSNYKPLILEDSLNISVGQRVLSLTNPRGFERSLSSGIISGLNRPIKSLDKGRVMDLIQTDVFASKGSSGGALLNTKGNLIGIVTSIESKTGKYEGIVFAIPTNTIISIVPQLIEKGHVTRGWVDFSFIPLDYTLKEYLKLDIDKGLIISRIDNNSSSEEMGIKPSNLAINYMGKKVYIGGDIITKVNNVEVKDFSDLYVLLTNTKPNDTITLTIYRDKKYKDVKIKLIERPSNIEIK